MSYRRLQGEEIIATADRLGARISERFPGSGLSKVAAELAQVTRETEQRIADLRRPRWGLRAGIGFLIVLIAAVALFALAGMQRPDSISHLGEFVQLLESTINDLIFVGVAILFLVTLEERLRRRDALRALHELRSLVHIVDMHQLTKDPDQFSAGRTDTKASPARALSPAQLGRYLDYCSELLSIIGKVATLYAQQLYDPVVLAAVGEVETLTAGLSNKIWQNLVILGTAPSSPAGHTRAQ